MRSIPAFAESLSEYSTLSRNIALSSGDCLPSCPFLRHHFLGRIIIRCVFTAGTASSGGIYDFRYWQTRTWLRAALRFGMLPPNEYHRFQRYPCHQLQLLRAPGVPTASRSPDSSKTKPRGVCICYHLPPPSFPPFLSFLANSLITCLLHKIPFCRLDETMTTFSLTSPEIVQQM